MAFCSKTDQRERPRLIATKASAAEHAAVRALAASQGLTISGLIRKSLAAQGLELRQPLAQ
jgi:hypothetical protein